MADDPDQLVQGEEGVALYLCGNVLPLCAVGQQGDQVEMVGEVPRGLVLLALHQLQERGERVVVVEQQHIVTCVGKLEGEGGRKGRGR